MLRFVLRLSSWVLYLIEKIFGVKITHSGELPKDTSLLFLANHFTRFETFITPYVLFQKYNRISRSLGDSSIFVGLLGKYMKLAGTISTKNKTKDDIITNDLVSQKADWVIYPEGCMVKNKLVNFEDDMFYIHTKYRDGPLYTGSAALALKAEILNMKKNSKHKKSIQIIPLTITYYPLRPGKNRLFLWINKYCNLQGTSFFEELEIEINLLLNSSINLHFDKAIPVQNYINDFLDKSGGSIEDDKLVEQLIDIQRKKLVNDVMRKVYKNLQINFDHIFILSLFALSTFKVSPSHLKALIYKNALELRTHTGYNIHPLLENELFNLILDNNYAPFIYAIKLTQMQKILYKDSQGDYLFDKNLLEKEYAFDKIRVKNTFQVILNEIRWQKEIVSLAYANAKLTQKELEVDNFNYIKNRERKKFEEEYFLYHQKLPPKEHLGSPIILYDSKNRVGVVFSHGYMAAPKEAQKLAEFLFYKGINVYLPRLSGHGTDPEALKHIKKQDWEEDFKFAVTAMSQVSDKVFIGGFSTGGLLALIHASKYKVDGVIAINSALRLNNLKVSYVVPTLHAFNEMIYHLKAKGIHEWIENKSEHPEINYTKHPLNGIAQMEKVMKKADGILTHIRAPLLVIQGDKDPIVNPKSATFIYHGVKSKEKKFVLLSRDKHAILLEDANEEVFTTIYNFIKNSLIQNGYTCPINEQKP